MSTFYRRREKRVHYCPKTRPSKREKKYKVTEKVHTLESYTHRIYIAEERHRWWKNSLLNVPRISRAWEEIIKLSRQFRRF